MTDTNDTLCEKVMVKEETLEEVQCFKRAIATVEVDGKMVGVCSYHFTERLKG